MSKPLALQIYSIREEMQAGFNASIERVAAKGFAGVEVAALPESTTNADAKVLFNSLGIEVCGFHSGLPLGDQRDAVLRTLDDLQAPYLVCPWLDPNTYFSSVDAVKKTCDLLNEGSKVVQEAGAQLLYHNHWFEFELLDDSMSVADGICVDDGIVPFELMLDYLDPAVGFELDAYWAKTAGYDPVKAVRALGERMPLLHVKDGPAVMDKAMTAVGDGIMDYPAIFAASQAQWQIIELDRCDTDMFEAVEKSFDYMVKNNYGKGK